MNGPSTDHFLRSGEWKRNPPFFVPTATTTLPFLIERAMSTTRNAGRIWTTSPGFSFASGNDAPISSSFTKTFTYGRRRPASSTTRSRMPGKFASSAWSIAATFDASRTTSSCPSVYERSAGGIRTSTPARAISFGETSEAMIPSPAPHPRRDEKPLACVREWTTALGSPYLIRIAPAVDGYPGHPGRRAPSREPVRDSCGHDDQRSRAERAPGSDRYRRRGGGPPDGEGKGV